MCGHCPSRISGTRGFLLDKRNQPRGTGWKMESSERSSSASAAWVESHLHTFPETWHLCESLGTLRKDMWAGLGQNGQSRVQRGPDLSVSPPSA